MSCNSIVRGIVFFKNSSVVVMMRFENFIVDVISASKFDMGGITLAEFEKTILT